MDAADNCFAVHRLALARALSLSPSLPFFFLMDGALITIKWRDPSALPVFGRLEIYGGAAMADEGRFRRSSLIGPIRFFQGIAHQGLRFGLRISFFFFFLDILILMYF